MQEASWESYSAANKGYFLLKKKTVSEGRANHFQGIELGYSKEPFPILRVGGSATFAWLDFRFAMDQWLLCGSLFLPLIHGSAYWVFHSHSCVLGMCRAKKLFFLSMSPWMMRNHTWEAAWGIALEEPQPHLDLSQIRRSWTCSLMPWLVSSWWFQIRGMWITRARGKTVVSRYSNNPQYIMPYGIHAPGYKMTLCLAIRFALVNGTSAHVIQVEAWKVLLHWALSAWKLPWDHHAVKKSDERPHGECGLVTSNCPQFNPVPNQSIS